MRAVSPLTTLVVTFVDATYFTQAIAADPIHGVVVAPSRRRPSSSLCFRLFALFVAGLPLLMWVNAGVTAAYVLASELAKRRFHSGARGGRADRDRGREYV